MRMVFVEEIHQILLAIAGVGGPIIVMQFKINKCVGRLEGMLTTHLAQKKG